MLSATYNSLNQLVTLNQYVTDYPFCITKCPKSVTWGGVKLNVIFTVRNVCN